MEIRNSEGQVIFTCDGELRYVSLDNTDLRGANLAQANLEGVIWMGVNLQDANLKEADLYWAVLFGANLSGANSARLHDPGGELANLIYYRGSPTRRSKS